MSRKKIKKKTPAIKKWEGFMWQVNQEAMLLCDCVQKGLMEEGTINIKVTRDESGDAVVDVGLAVPDDVANIIAEERLKRRQ